MDEMDRSILSSRLAKVGLIVFIAMCALSIPVVSMRMENAEYERHARLARDIQALAAQLKKYKGLNGFYPTTEQGLQALVSMPQTDPRPMHWQQLDQALRKDPWRNDYIYRCPGIHYRDGYDLFSAGSDRKPDTVDDDWGD